MPSALPLVFLALVGFAGNREKQVVGTWKTQGGEVKAAKDKTFKSKTGGFTLAGVWQIAGDEVSFIPETLNGKSIEEIQNAAQSPSTATKILLNKIGRTGVFVLSKDGKTLRPSPKDKGSALKATFKKA